MPHFCGKITAMRVFRYATLFLMMPLLFSASRCQTQTPPALSGHISLRPGRRPVLYLVQPRSFEEIASNYAGLVVDSAVVQADGSFAFNRFEPPAAPVLLELVIQPVPGRFPNKLIDDDPEKSNYLPLVVQKGMPLRVKAEAEHFQATAMTEPFSADNQALRQLRDIRRQAFGHSPAADEHVDEGTLMEQATRLAQFRAPLMAFADTTASMWAALVAVRWVSPENDYERVPEFLSGQCIRWRERYPEHPFTAQLCRRAAPGKLPVMIGDTIPDVPLPMSDGDTLRLHTLLGARLTLIDLWASWCAPCRRENREVLAPLWAEYRDAGLAIVGYALDSSPEAWQAAIRKDGASWAQASHLGGDVSPFLEALRVTTIPANFLLDADGKIVARNLHGQALKDFVRVFVQ